MDRGSVRLSGKQVETQKKQGWGRIYTEYKSIAIVYNHSASTNARKLGKRDRKGINVEQHYKLARIKIRYAFDNIQ